MNRIKCFVFVVLSITAIFASVSFAQSSESKNTLNNASLSYFNESADAKEAELLFKMLYFDAPYTKFFYVLKVYKNGTFSSYRNVPNWAIQDSSDGTFNEIQLEQIKRLISQISTTKETVPTIEPQTSENYTAFVFTDGENYNRIDFNGKLPFDIQQIVSYTNTELEKSLKSVYESDAE